MTTHTLRPSRQTVHGHFSPDLPPILTIAPGDAVVFETLDAGWGHWWEGEGDDRQDVVQVKKQDKKLDAGPALCGPVYITGAAPGDLLRIRIGKIETKDWGFCAGGGWPSETNDFLGVSAPGQHRFTKWKLDSQNLIGTDEQGMQLKLRPFLGTLGMPMAAPAIQNSIHPQATGGNLDCKVLVEGSTLYLPIAVAGGLFSVGDGHAAQGNGELSGLGLECPMKAVHLTFDVLKEHPAIDFPLANTPAGWVTFGFDEDLNKAALQASDYMLRLLCLLYGFTREEALPYASLLMDLHISQLVNGVKAVHAVLPHQAFLNREPLPLL